ncbi:DUF2244 domain-containing protein [Sphingorhabdus contaminans]|uniref:DUF2244 domain-containing protein n=1 Tax=Sphingorhabdus contaminans TaxID=1343899 RepID=UPI003D282298
MYYIPDRSIERFGTCISASQIVVPDTGVAAHPGIVIHMEQNRSHFPEEGRNALSVIITLLMLTSVLPALRGNLLVPLFSIGAMALLVWALEFHQKSAPYSERLELADGEVRYSDSAGRTFAIPSYWTRLEIEQRAPLDVRLHLRSRDRRFEFGKSLNLEERLAIRPVIENALATAKGL